MSFGNFTMKSFSLSSLGDADGTYVSKDNTHGCEPSVERPYHSLTKKRKDPNRESWRRSWGSAVSGSSAGYDIWPVLKRDYDFIMDSLIIDTCREANGELSSGNMLCTPANYTETVIPTLNRQWSLNHMIDEFNDMCQWLTAIQEEIYSSPENLTNRNLRLSRINELKASESRLQKFLEQSSAILERIPEARDEVTWRVSHLQVKWENVVVQLGTGDKSQNCGEKIVDTAHELRCLRRWLHTMEGRLPPPSLNRSWKLQELNRKLKEHEVLQRDVECHGRIVNSVIRLCEGSESARSLERRWHLLYLRAIEWQCYLEACLTKLKEQGAQHLDNQTDSDDDEPVLKQPRLSRKGSPKLICRPKYSHDENATTASSYDSYSEEEHYDQFLRYLNGNCESDLELSINLDSGCITMESLKNEQSVPETESCSPVNQIADFDEFQRGTDAVDGVINDKQELTLYDDEEPITKTPPTVVKRRKRVDSSKFNRSDRKSKQVATFYFKHHDTDSDRKGLDTEPSQESSEEGWTYVVGGDKQQQEDENKDAMTTSFEMNYEADIIKESNQVIESLESLPLDEIMESKTPDLIKTEQLNRYKEDIERLVNQAEELVQKQVQQQHMISKKLKSKTIRPLIFDETGRAKISRIKEWLKQNSDGCIAESQGVDSYDASGEYTTESEMDKQSTTSEDPTCSISTYRNMTSSMDMSTCTVTPASNNTPVHTKVTLRKKRNNSNNTRPWSVSCISQLTHNISSLNTTPIDETNVASNYCHTAGISISESALNMMLGGPADGIAGGNVATEKSTGSAKTTVQGHISSTTTINEACLNCIETQADVKMSSIRRKKIKLRRRYQGDISLDELKKSLLRGNRLFKSLSFSGHILGEHDDKNERHTASDPSTSRRNRLDTTTSASSNDSDNGLNKTLETHITHLRRSIDSTHIISQQEQIIEQEVNLPTPSFKIGPSGGLVRPRLAVSSERDRSLLGIQLSHQNQFWDCGEKDSDVDRSINTGTEEHSSFSEQAWDFYQEKYQSEPYSEAPDSDAARRLQEFGDDYRTFLDSQSDCCSSHPDNDSPKGNRRYKKSPPSDGKKNKRTISNIERKKSLFDSFEKTRTYESDCIRRRKVSDSLERRNTKRSADFDLISGRGRHNSNVTSSDVNSSMEYNAVNKPDIIDSLGKRDSISDSSKQSNDWRSSDDVRTLMRRSADQLQSTETLLEGRELSPDVLLCTEYSDIIATCRDNMSVLSAVLSGQTCQTISHSICCNIRDLITRWASLKSAAMRRGGARRLRRDLAALRDSLADICDGDCTPPLVHSKNELERRIEVLKERLSRLLEHKVSLLKLNVSVIHILDKLKCEDTDSTLAKQLTDEKVALHKAWDDLHQSTSTELISLDKARTAWLEWEAGLQELQNCLRRDEATLKLLEKALQGGGDKSQVDLHLRDIASLLADKKNQNCDKGGSLSDSGISDGDSESGSTRVKRLNALRNLARALHHALAPGSHGLRLVTKRMEQAENELRTLQESCQALVTQSNENGDYEVITSDGLVKNDTQKRTASGDPDKEPSSGTNTNWFWRAFRSSLPIQLCLIALLCAAYLLGKPKCCDGLNTLAGFSFTPQLRYVRGPPPM